MKKIAFVIFLLCFACPGFADNGLDLKLKPGNKDVATKGGEAYCLLKLQGSDKEIKDRSAVNLSLVIDRSGSMSGDKIKYVRQASIHAINMLNEQMDMVATVIYDDEIEVIYPSQKVDKEKLTRLIKEKVTDRGSTNLHGGMMKGVEEALKSNKGSNVTRVLLLSDGLANQGVTEPEFIARDARKSFEKGMTITTLGVGADYNENLMVSIAKNGHGNYYFIEKPAQITDVFSQEFASLLSVVAKDIVMDLKPLNGVTIETAIGFDFKENRIDVNPIFTNGLSRFLFKLRIPQGKHGSGFEALEVTISYYDTVQKKKVVLNDTLKLAYHDELKTGPLMDAEVYEIYTDLLLSDNLEKITKYLDKGENKKALELNQQQIEDLKTANNRLKSKEVEEDIKKLEEQQKMIEALGDRHYQETTSGRVLKKGVQKRSYDKKSK